MYNYEEEQLLKIEDGETGEIKFYALIQVGGIDETGKYELVLDARGPEGPAQGERVYE